MTQMPFSDLWDSLMQEQKIVVLSIAFMVLAVISAFAPEDTSPAPLVAMVMVVLIAFPVHEFAHAAMAVALGDNTPRDMGRYTLNPLEHIDPLGAVLLIFAGFGWAKPVVWRPTNLKVNERLGTLLVAASGPFSNLLLALLSDSVARLLLALNTPLAGNFSHVLVAFTTLNVMLFVFNLLPAPPLDGAHILIALLPGDIYTIRAMFEQFGFFFLIFVVMFGGTVVQPLVSMILFSAFGLV